MNDVTLEITVSPTDLRHAVHILPHQLRQLAGQVAEVQFTLNAAHRRDRGGETLSQSERGLRDLLQRLCEQHANARVVDVDYSPAARAAVSRRFFDDDDMPAVNHDGGPYYSYFFGWHTASHDLVLHADSDMLLGGGSQAWVEEAVAILRGNADVLCVAPLPGPPTADGSLPDRALKAHTGMGGAPELVPYGRVAYKLHGCSTRLWLFDRASIARDLQGFPRETPRVRSRLRAYAEGHPAIELPERSISRRMNALDLRRIDFLGGDPGMWSLHPTMRSEVFYSALPDLVHRVEAGDIPDEQRGDYDVNDSLVDWTSARAARRGQGWPRRVMRRRASQIVDRVGRLPGSLGRH